MFGEEEMKKAHKAYERETSIKGNDDFTTLRRDNTFFFDIKNIEAMEQQARQFINLISNINRDAYTNRYVLQTFLLEFCKYLDKDFLFSITDGKTFFQIKDRIKKFTGEMYETHKKFTQSVGLNSLEHLLEDYGSLLRFVDQYTVERGEEKGASSFGDFWSGGRLW